MPCSILRGDSANDDIADRPSRRKPFTQWVRNLASLKNKGSGDQQEKNMNKKNATLKHKKTNTHNGTFKNNPYPESGHLQQRNQSLTSSANGQFTPTSRPTNGSYGSLPRSAYEEREAQSNSNKSGAPTLATNAGTIHSDAGHSKAATTTTRGGALSSTDGAGPDSTFSSPNQSQHSLSTTLTTIQSASPGNTLQGASGQPTPNHHGSLNNPNPVMFSHQFPVSPANSTANTISAIPRHLSEAIPNTYGSATANGLLTDNASILTLASSSKRRRRSMDTDASVRALAPSSVWGGSRESLPLSVLSGNPDPGTASGGFYTSQSRPSIGGLASAERASVYSSQGIAAPALASERNSYYSHKPSVKGDLADSKSLRSITNIDARSLAGDAKSVNADAKSTGGDVGSLRGYEGSVRSGAVGHGRNDSTPGSIGSPLVSPALKHTSTSGALSRRSSDWQELEEKERNEGEEEEEVEGKQETEEHEHEHPQSQVGDDGDA